MRRRLLAIAIVPFLLTACSGGDESDEPGKQGAQSPASESPEPLDGEYSQPGIAQDAKVGAFCTAMEEVDDAIDDGEAGDADDWLRIVAALDEVYEVGVPKDLPAAGIAEIDHVDRLVRQSNSVEELESAVAANPPKSDVVDDYLTEHCE